MSKETIDRVITDFDEIKQISRGIFSEINKEDFSIYRLSQVENAIKRLKNGRKRFAIGYNLADWEVRKIGVYEHLYFKFPIDFEASIKILLIKDKFYDGTTTYGMDLFKATGASLIFDNTLIRTVAALHGGRWTNRTRVYDKISNDLYKELEIGEVTGSVGLCASRAEKCVEAGNMWIAIE